MDNVLGSPGDIKHGFLGHVQVSDSLALGWTCSSVLPWVPWGVLWYLVTTVCYKTL